MRTVCFLYTWSGHLPMWQKRSAKLKAGDIAVIVSGTSGPFPYDPQLHAHIQSLKDRGVLVFGYVHCSISPEVRITRPLMDIFGDIGAWRKLYGIRFPFLDEWPPDRHIETQYMWSTVRGFSGRSGTPQNPFVIVNQGMPDPLSRKPTDGMLVVTHEQKYLPGWAPQPWEVVVVHSHPDPTSVRAELALRGWQWGYTTSDGPDGDPYDEDEAN